MAACLHGIILFSINDYVNILASINLSIVATCLHGIILFTIKYHVNIFESIHLYIVATSYPSGQIHLVSWWPE